MSESCWTADWRRAAYPRLMPVGRRAAARRTAGVTLICAHAVHRLRAATGANAGGNCFPARADQ